MQCSTLSYLAAACRCGLQQQNVQHVVAALWCTARFVSAHAYCQDMTLDSYCNSAHRRLPYSCAIGKVSHLSAVCSQILNNMVPPSTYNTQARLAWKKCSTAQGMTLRCLHGVQLFLLTCSANHDGCFLNTSQTNEAHLDHVKKLKAPVRMLLSGIRNVCSKHYTSSFAGVLVLPEEGPLVVPISVHSIFQNLCCDLSANANR